MAQNLADGMSQLVAYLVAFKPELEPAQIDAINHGKGIEPKEAQSLRNAAANRARKEALRLRVKTILAERHDKRMTVSMADVKVNRSYVVDRLTNLVDRCMQAVPVLNKQGDPIGTYKFEPMAAAKGLELLGLEQGMFERRHKHLHAQANPLDGNRQEIVGRLGILLSQLTDRDLESIGLRRIETVEVRVERAHGVGEQQGQAVYALPEAS